MYAAPVAICMPCDEVTSRLVHVLIVVAEEVDSKLHNPGADDDVGIISMTNVFTPAGLPCPIFLPLGDLATFAMAVDIAPLVKPFVCRLVSHLVTNHLFRRQHNTKSRLCNTARRIIVGPASHGRSKQTECASGIGSLTS